MPSRTRESPHTPALDTGWVDLAEGRWEAARELFERATRSGEKPEAHEGLSWAAWWLDDAEVVFAARGRAYQLYKQRGDTVGAARIFPKDLVNAPREFAERFFDVRSWSDERAGGQFAACECPAEYVGGVRTAVALANG